MLTHPHPRAELDHGVSCKAVLDLHRDNTPDTSQKSTSLYTTQLVEIVDIDRRCCQVYNGTRRWIIYIYILTKKNRLVCMRGILQTDRGPTM